jgi:hypothetical protein
LLEEILPEVEKTVKLRHDAASRAIAGQSSGGLCAFTVAWERPNEFGKVLSWTGSFTNIAAGDDLRSGGHNYEALVRRVPKKPIRVILQDGSNDLDGNAGSWWLANQTLAKSLEYAGYDYRYDWGSGFHTYLHGRAIFPDSLRWLWRDHTLESHPDQRSASKRPRSTMLVVVRAHTRRAAPFAPRERPLHQQGSMSMSNTLTATFVSAVCLASVLHAQQAQAPAPTSKPSPVTMTGCVSAKPVASGQYTFEDAGGGGQYRLTGKAMRKFAGQRVEVVTGRSGSGLTIKGGLWPAPSGGARGVALDPGQEAIARQRPAGRTSAADAAPELRVSNVRLVEGACQ